MTAAGPSLSSRVRRDLSPNPLALELAARRERGARVLDLTVSNPTRAALAYPERELRRALGEGAWMLYEPEPLGHPAARRAVAAYHAARGEPAAAGRVVLTTSTSEAYGYILKLLTEPGDHLIVPRPSYPLFEFLASMENVAVDSYDLHYHGEWSLDPGSLAAGIGPRTRAVVLVHPNNPTGSFLRREELDALGRLCREHGLALVADEVFRDYVLEAAAPPPALLPGPPGVLSFTLNGLSKILALPQLKLGWMVLDGPDELVRPALEALELIGDTYLSVGTPVQAALPALLELRPEIQASVLERLRGNLGRLRAATGGACAGSALPVEGGWSAVLRVPATRSSEDWALGLLREHGVLVHPGRFFDFRREAYLVLSLLTPPEPFAEGVDLLLDFCSSGC